MGTNGLEAIKPMTVIVTDKWSSLPGYPGVQHTLTTIRARKGFVVLKAVKIIFGGIGGGVQKS
jgi:hypothetical protein